MAAAFKGTKSCRIGRIFFYLKKGNEGPLMTIRFFSLWDHCPEILVKFQIKTMVPPLLS